MQGSITSFSELERMGRALGASVVHVAEQISGIPREPGARTPKWDGVGGIQASSQFVPLCYQPVPTRAQVEASTSAFERAWREHVLATLDRDVSRPEGEPCAVQVLRLGPILIVAIEGEPFVEIGQQIEARLLAHAEFEAVIVLGYANGNVGYLCTAAAYEEGGDEAASAHINYHRPAPYTKETEAWLVRTAVTLAERLLS